MSKYYTNITVYGPHILYRGVKNGRRIKEKINYAPTLFLPAKKKTDYKTLFGEYLEPMQFANIREARDFVKRYESVENFKVYGNDRYAYAFIADTHKGLIDWNIEELSIAIIDIEVGSENGFPDPYKTTEPITAIAVRQLNGGTTVYGCGHYDNNDETVTYIRCQDEIDLCKKFLNDWQHNYPDVVTGWNTEGFDIPYLVNRFTKLFGEKEARKYDTLHQLYKLNYQKFIEYNIKDVELILKLEEKLKLIQLALTMAYDTKCNYSDVFAQTRMWDALIYNHLLDQKIIVPPKEVSHKGEAFEGAYVKEPQVGNHDWVASFDLNSLYPHLIQMYNISPETLIPVSEHTEEMRKVIHDGVTVDKLLEMKVDTSKISDVILTPNAQYFRKDVQGFLPKMMEEMYEDRKKFKKLMLKAEQEYENETDVAKKKQSTTCEETVFELCLWCIGFTIFPIL